MTDYLVSAPNDNLLDVMAVLALFAIVVLFICTLCMALGFIPTPTALQEIIDTLFGAAIVMSAPT